MIVVLNPGASPERTQHLIHWLEEQNLGVHVSKGEYQTVLGLIGNTSKVDMEMLQSLDIVDSVTRVSDPFKAVNRKFHPDDSTIVVGPASIGGGHFGLIAGPCSVETEEQIIYVAQQVKAAGANFLRGGAFKPRTSPYDFQGLGAEGIRLLLEAKKATGLPIVTEIMDIRNLPLFEEVDVIQVGARNTQNFDMLKELGKTQKPILLKRGLAGTIKELLMSAEYIMANGNENVILCERGIRTYESTYTGGIQAHRRPHPADPGGDEGMTVGIIGLGLIGGSLAKAFQRDESVTVLGWDADHSIVEFAEIAQAIDGELTDEKLQGLDLLLLATYPEAVVEHMTRLAPLLDKTTLVIDCAGTKEKVCASVFPLAKQYGFSFLGGHPMAGTHFSGFKYSRADLFDGAPMVLVPPAFDDIRLLDRAKKLLEPVGFGRVSITSAQEHDKRIAFTSQMAHIISNAYIKSPTARQHDGFSAGSYKDLTRVAWLNPDMWAELFLENRENLLFELGTLIEDLTKYKDAIERNDFGTLRQLLDDGRRIKEEVDGK